MHFFRDRTNIFLLAVLAPLVIIASYYLLRGLTVLGVLVPFYGFLIILLKKDELRSFQGHSVLMRLTGVAGVIVSFVLFYVSVVFFPSASYGVGGLFYAVYVLGLTLIFFNAQELKEFASFFFLVVAGGFSPYISEWLEYVIQPFVPNFVVFFYLVLRLFGIPAVISSPNVILLERANGRLPVSFEAGCIGIQSFWVFSIIAVVTMLEETASRRTKVLWSIGGVIGTFLVNTIRVSLIAVIIFYYGYENWGVIHSVIGYSMFLLWLVFFLAVFSKRAQIRKRMQVLLQIFSK